VRGLNNIVRRLAALWIASDSVLLAEPREVLSAGKEFVYVGLVTGVEENNIFG
jgi:hypothetical protein